MLSDYIRERLRQRTATVHLSGLIRGWGTSFTRVSNRHDHPKLPGLCHDLTLPLQSTRMSGAWGPPYRVDGADYAFDEWIRAELEARVHLMRDLVEQLPRQIAHFADLLFATLQSGGKLLFAGNGGSAATAQHLAAEFVGRLRRERAPMAALALNADTITLTALSNDFGVEMAYVRPLQALARREDALILLTTSGRSPNLVAAARAARAIHCRVVAMTGARGGPVADAVDLWLAAPTDKAPCVQEAHLVIGHMVCELVESRVFTDSHGHADPP